MNAYELTVPIRRPWLALALALFFIPWLNTFFPLITLIGRGIVRPESQTEFFFCLVVGGFFSVVFAAFGLALLWPIGLNLLGKETLKVEEGRLAMRQSLLGLGRWKTFPVEEISNLRTGGVELKGEVLQKTEGMTVQELVRTGRVFAWARGAFRFFGISPTLVFRAEGQTRWFGSSPDESRAREILARLRMHLPESAFAQTEPTLTLFGKPEDS